MTSFFNKPSARASPFSIDDAFDIPEEEWNEDDEDGGHGMKPIIRSNGASGARSNGYVGLEMNGVSGEQAVRFSDRPPSPGRDDPKANSDSASLVNSVNTTSGQGAGESGYYEGRNESYSSWLKHPKIKANMKLVVAAAGLVILGIVLMITGIVAYCVPSLESIQGVVFIIAGLICVTPGAYHLGYIYLALKGKRGFDFNRLPLFNN